MPACHHPTPSIACSFSDSCLQTSYSAGPSTTAFKPLQKKPGLHLNRASRISYLLHEPSSSKFSCSLFQFTSTDPFLPSTKVEAFSTPNLDDKTEALYQHKVFPLPPFSNRPNPFTNANLPPSPLVDLLALSFPSQNFERPRLSYPFPLTKITNLTCPSLSQSL